MCACERGRERAIERENNRESHRERENKRERERGEGGGGERERRPKSGDYPVTVQMANNNKIKFAPNSGQSTHSPCDLSVHCGVTTGFSSAV